LDGSSKELVIWENPTRVQSLKLCGLDFKKGILSSPDFKPGKVLPPAIAEMKQFYVSDKISRIMPGTKDYVSVNSEGKKICLQK
jgi:hypothetical protein